MVSWAAVQVQFFSNELNLNWPLSSRKKLNCIENFNSVLNCYTALVLCLGERGVLVRMETVGRDGVPGRVVTGAAWHLVVGAARGRWQEEIHSTGWSDKQTLTTWGDWLGQPPSRPGVARNEIWQDLNFTTIIIQTERAKRGCRWYCYLHLTFLHDIRSALGTVGRKGSARRVFFVLILTKEESWEDFWWPLPLKDEYRISMTACEAMHIT